MTRWLDREATLRVASVDVLDVARGLCALHDLDGDDACNLSKAVAGGLLLASDLKSAQTLSLQIELGERVFHVDATPEGLVRAMVTTRSHGASIARLVARRFGQSGLLYQSVVDIPSNSLTEILERFIAQSEQLRIRFDLRCHCDESGIPQAAFGALVRGFPATSPEALESLFRAWEHRADWTCAAPCDHLDDKTWDRISTQEIRHHCPCSRERALSSIQALGKETLQDAAAKGEPMEVVCDFCRSSYVFAPEEFGPSVNG